MRGTIIAVLGLAAATLAPANAEIIDFEEFSVGTPGPVESKGFTITGSLVEPGPSPVTAPVEIMVSTRDGTKALGGDITGRGYGYDGVTASVTVERTDGGVFAVHSVDLNQLNNGGGCCGVNYIHGIDAAGNSVALGLTWPGTGEWLSLRSVTWEAESDSQAGLHTVAVEIDNINVTKLATDVAIDVLPGDAINEVFPNRAGKLPVAVLSSAEFDATQVDPATLRFGSAEALIAEPVSIVDVDSQHGSDTVARFRVEESGIFCNDNEVSLTGATYGGSPITGTDTIDASDCESGSCHEY